MSEHPKASAQGRLLRVLPHVALSLLTLLLATNATLAILGASGGEPAVPLDDAYIHFQYARSFAELSPLGYAPGAEPNPGATSLLWPALLAPFLAAGLAGTSLIWVAWLFGWLALGLLARETYFLALGLVDRPLAVAAAAMVLAFGGHVWCAGSGMEVVPFAWMLVRSARRAADWPGEKTPRRAELVALAWLTPLMRPEGALASALVAGAWLLFPRGRSRAWALAPLAGLALPPLINWLFTGHAASTTLEVKWLLSSPYDYGGRIWTTIADNLATLYLTLLDGQSWSSLFVPRGGRVVAWLALPAVVWAGWRHALPWRAGVVLLVGLGMLVPTTYDTFLWNRLRYLWPFAAAWFVGLAALADALGVLLARLRPELGVLRLGIAGAFVGSLAATLSHTIDDLAQSSWAITRQQVALGQWAASALPESAIIGVNDAGAITYFSGRRTFDIVGLTTPGEARFWVAGAGSRFEHYERMDRSLLPTHYIVYPEWLSMPQVLGPSLTERVVPGATILGGTRMVAYEADYSMLDSGQHPEQPGVGRLVDRLDVADLPSEAEHDYQLFWANRQTNVVVSHGAAADGARTHRTLERFWLALEPGGTLVLRVGAPAQARLEVRAGERGLGQLELDAGAGWQEHRLQLPSDLAAERQRVEVQAGDGERFSALHYWSYGAGSTALRGR